MSIQDLLIPIAILLAALIIVTPTTNLQRANMGC